MKILLVLPAAPEHRVTREHPQVPARAMFRFSLLPLTTVAALTPPEHTVTLCDEHVEPVDFDTDADVVGISFMTGLAPRAFELAAAFRARGKVTVAGGYHPTLCPDETATHFDVVVVGEAEGQWPHVLADIAAGRLQRIYRQARPCDPATIPAPRRDLLARTARHYATIGAMQVGRGCVHACQYCSVTAFHRRTYRARPLAHVLAELRDVPRNFIFVDDNIVADPAYARALFTAMAPLGKRWVAQAPLTLADDPELLRLARRAGCAGLFVGIETTNRANLTAMAKGFNATRAIGERVAAIRGAGIGVIAGLIVGMDEDTVEVFQDTLAFLQEVRVDNIQLNILTPLPGTPLYAAWRRDGRIRDDDWCHYDFRHTVITPRRMTAAELQDGADWLYREFYRLDRVLLRAARAVFTLGPLGAWLGLRLSLAYRYDNRRQRIVGRNPAAAQKRQRAATTRLRPGSLTPEPWMRYAWSKRFSKPTVNSSLGVGR